MVERPRISILVFAGSIRAGALSAKLAALAAKELALMDADVTHISLADYPLPFYDGDLEEKSGIPENATKLAQLIAAHRGVFVATPEYNNSLPALLKNTIGCGSTSDGRIGGARALIDLRKVLTAGLQGIMVPAKVEIGRAQDAFSETGELVDEAPAKLLRNVCRQLVDLSARLAD
jgi:NAD(P)H-dependent FMN reductase